jgi:hypothetical protein
MPAARRRVKNWTTRYRLCNVRGPEGIVVELAAQSG